MKKIFAPLFIFLIISSSENEPLHRKDLKTIIDQYSFVADFSERAGERELPSDELFWKYPFKLEKPFFNFENHVTNPNEELPATPGDGLPYQHLNQGRSLFLEGKYDDAKAVWLSAKSTYGKKFPHHRRLDYFLGLAFMELSEIRRKEFNLEWTDLWKPQTDPISMTRMQLNNAQSFFAWAYVRKKGTVDSVVDQATPKSFYNLAAIYYMAEKYNLAYGIAKEGLNFLRKTGRNDYRVKFHQILAESFIKNRSYLEAIQEMDTALRMGANSDEASMLFSRVGDIYFDLNNYELAEDAFAISSRIDNEHEKFRPIEFALRGESLFWLGKFRDAQEMFRYALEGSSVNKNGLDLQINNAAFSQLRLADIWLALKEKEKAQLAYFQVEHDFPNTPASVIAKVRLSCLELPFYDGNNVTHTRNFLQEIKTIDPSLIAPQALELSWACHVGSYADRERTDGMVDRVREFYAKYPSSRFLASLIEPVKEVQAEKIYDYFKDGKIYFALDFFEKNRATLFQNIPTDLSSRLFKSYVDTHQSEKAKEFYFSYIKENKLNDNEKLRVLVFLFETKNKDSFKNKNEALKAENFNLANSPLNRSFIKRIENADVKHEYEELTYKVFSIWAKEKPELLCELQIPNLSKLLQQNKNKLWMTELDNLITKNLPALFEKDVSCSETLLDLEMQVYENSPADLISKYLNRKAWSLTPTLITYFWQVSEMALAANDISSAQIIWNFIIAKGSPDSMETKMAKLRLDPRKTTQEYLFK